MIKAGALDRHVSILRRAADAVSDINEPVPVWEVVGVAWGAKVERFAKETLAAQEHGQPYAITLTLRWSPLVEAVTAADRLQCDGVTYEIVGSREIGRRVGREFECMGARDD